MEQRTGEGMRKSANVQAMAIGELLIRQSDGLTSLSGNTVLQDAAIAANILYVTDHLSLKEDPTLYIEELNRRNEKWQTCSDTDLFVKNRLINLPAVELKKYQQLFPEHSHVFVTDRIGALVAATSRPEKYYHYDTEWWQAAFNDDQGAVYISQPTIDEDTGVLMVNIAAPIYSPDSQEIQGIVHSTYHLNDLIELLETSEKGNGGHPDLFVPPNQLFDPDIGQLVTVDEATLAQLNGLENQGYWPICL
jgi:hypothetical protein